MERFFDINEVWDGRYYRPNDMVRCGCNDCAGCSACCQGMEDTITLDPYDVYLLSQGTGQLFESMLGKYFDLKMTDGVPVPHLRHDASEGHCIFLDENGRCGIHAYRPGICRLFPMARMYEDGEVKYFLQVHECPAKNKTKVKLEKWLDMPDLKEHEAFLLKWHRLLGLIRDEMVKCADNQDRQKDLLLMYIYFFYKYPTDPEKSFYTQFDRRMSLYLRRMGIEG